MNCKWSKSFLCGIAVVTLVTLVGCGGSGDSDETVVGVGGGGGSTDTNLTTITSFTAVDPYIVGAVFQEVVNDVVIQESAPSGVNGIFSFPAFVHKNCMIIIKPGAKGLHGGVPYAGNLKLKVEVESGSPVINPLTSLVAEGASKVQVLAMVQAIAPAGVTITEADLFVDPIARLNDGTITPEDKALLAINMAVNSALQALDGNISNLYTIQSIADSIETKLTTQVFDNLISTSTPTDVTQAAATGVAITSYIVEDTQAAVANGGSLISSISSSTNSLTPTYIDNVATAIAIAAPGEIVVITDPAVVPAPIDTNDLAQLYYQAGKTAYESAAVSSKTSEFKLAIEKFLAAAELKDSITDSALKDKVLFFGAFAKVMILADPISDNTSNGLNNFGDILDAFGLVNSPAATDRSLVNAISPETCTTSGNIVECDLNLSTDSPRSGALQAFAYGKIGAQLQEAVTMLDGISTSFTATINDAGVDVEFDDTDAKFIYALANGMLAQLNLVQAYNIDVDIDLEKSKIQAGTGATWTPDDLLAANQNLGKLQNAALMANVRTYSYTAVTALQAAVGALKIEADSGAGQANDFIKLDDTNCYYVTTSVPVYDLYGQFWYMGTNFNYTCDPTVYNDAAAIAAFEGTLAEAEKAIQASTYEVIGKGEDGISGNADDTVDAVIDVSKFFAGIDLRSKLPATFDKGAFATNPGMLPDPTFGGVLTQIYGQSPTQLNTDEDGDGSPDIFGMTYFVPEMLAGQTFQTSQFGQRWTYTFETSTALSAKVSYMKYVVPVGQPYGYYTEVTETISGTYSTAQNVLTLNFDNAFEDISKIVITLRSNYSAGFSINKVYSEGFNSAGVSIHNSNYPLYLSY